MSFLPVVPPLPTGPLPPPVPGHHVGGQVGGHEGAGGAPSLLQPAQEQAWGMLAGLGMPLPGMWGERGSQSQMPILPGQREAGGTMRGTSMEAEPVASGRLAVQDHLPERGVGEELKGSVKSSPVNPWTAEKLRELHDQAQGSRGVPDPVELLRAKCLQEAEVRFQEEVQKLGQPSSNSSFQSAVEAPGGKVQGGGEMQAPKPVTAPIVNVGPMAPGATPVVYPWPCPPGLPGQLPWGNGVCGIFPNGVSGPSTSPNAWVAPEESLGDQTRSVELPVLGLEATSLAFGDWLTTLEPIVSEISPGASQWWQLTLKSVSKAYEEWLTADPLQRLRLGPVCLEEANKWPRTERKMLSLLLPENVKNEVVTTRKMTVAQVLFILYVKCQPGGQSERMNLIRNLTELKLTNNMLEVAQGIRTWMRWWSRSEELGVTLPDPVVLAGVLVKASDHLAKSGAQVAYRLATSRQQLLVDTRPTLENVKIFAEHLQAEAEEMSMGVGTGGGKGLSLKAVAVQPTSGTSTMTSTGTAGGELREGGAGDKDACRFWMTEKGCRRGDRCKFKHCRLSPKENRCFNCSGLNHSKTSCPFLKKEGKGEETVKVAKVKGGSWSGSPEKPESGGAGGEEANVSTSSGTRTLVEDVPTGGKGKPSGGAPQNEETVTSVGGLVEEASALLKPLQRARLMAVQCKSLEPLTLSMDDEGMMGKVGLLDGGATHPLRKGSRQEIEEAEEAPVDLAHGRVWLRRRPVTGTILVEGHIEPIVPARGLIELGKLQWSRNGCVVVRPKRYVMVVPWWRRRMPWPSLRTLRRPSERKWRT